MLANNSSHRPVTNQSVYPQTANQPATQIAPSQRLYSFQALPKPIQERLLRLQNTNGDFVRTSNTGTSLWIVLECFLLGGFLLYVLLVVSSGTGAKMLVPLFAGSAIWLTWIIYIGWKLFKMSSSPIGEYLYLTQTQLIQTSGGYVRYRDLLEVRDFHFLTIRGRGGNRYVLTCRLFDNDVFKFVFTLGMFSSKTVEAKAAKDKAARWRAQAIDAFQRRDAAYFNSRNVFQGLAEANTPMSQRPSGIVPVIVLLVITSAVMGIGLTVYGLVNSRSRDNDSWNSAVSKNTVTQYRYYIRGTRGKHTAEAGQRIDRFYDETVNRIKENKANATDKQGVEAVLNLLESARLKQDNEVRLTLPGITYGDLGDDIRRKISQQFKKMFPTETLRVEETFRSSSVNPLISSMELKIKQVEQAKTPNQRSKGSKLNTAKATEPIYDFNCLLSTPDKPKYSFELKSATVEDFNNELARKFGVVGT